MTIRLRTDGPIARLLLDRALKRNAMTTAMFEALPDLIAQAVADPAVRVIVLQSNRSGVFCAGADIGEMSEHAADPAWRAINERAIGQAQYALTRAAKPVVALIDGDCVGAGCGLAIACDLRVATARARFGITPAKLGLVYPLHDTKLLVDLVGPGQAKRILFTAALIDAAEALRIGLIDLVADDADELIETIATNSLHSTSQSKAMVRRILDGQTHEDDASRAIFIDAFAGPDFVEGVAAFLEKRPVAFG